MHVVRASKITALSDFSRPYYLQISTEVGGNYRNSLKRILNVTLNSASNSTHAVLITSIKVIHTKMQFKRVRNRSLSLIITQPNFWNL